MDPVDAFNASIMRMTHMINIDFLLPDDEVISFPRQLHIVFDLNDEFTGKYTTRIPWDIPKDSIIEITLARKSKGE